MMKDEAVYVWPQQQVVENVALNNHDKVDQRSYSPIPGLKARGPPICAKAISAGAKHPFSKLFYRNLQMSPTLHLYSDYTTCIGHMHTCWKKLSVDHGLLKICLYHA